MSISEELPSFLEEPYARRASFDTIAEKIIVLSTTVLQPEAAEGLYDQAKAYQDVISDKQRLKSEVADLRQQLQAKEASLAKIESLAIDAQDSLNDIAMRLDSFSTLVQAERPEIDFSETTQLQQVPEQQPQYTKIMAPPAPKTPPKSTRYPMSVVVGRSAVVEQADILPSPATLSGGRETAVRDFTDSRPGYRKILSGIGKSAVRE